MRLLKKNYTIITVFSKTAFYDVNMHIFVARGFQIGENEPPLVFQVSPVSARTQNASQNDPKMGPESLQNGPKMDFKIDSKWNRNERKIHKDDVDDDDDDDDDNDDDDVLMVRSTRAQSAPRLFPKRSHNPFKSD